MLGRRNSDHVPLQSADPMSSGNPYASQSPRGFEQPQKKSRKKMWIIIGVIVALIVIIGAVLGGVLGSRASNDSSSSGSGSSADQANGGNSGGAVPSGVSGVNSEAVTATNQDRYLAVATNSNWMLPVYPSTVSLPIQFRCQNSWLDWNCRIRRAHRFWIRSVVARRLVHTQQQLNSTSPSTRCSPVQVGRLECRSAHQRPILQLLERIHSQERFRPR